jgi:hypothetical protein
MSVIKKTSYLRFERKYNELLTVLEGEELSQLLENFFKRYRSLLSEKDQTPESAISLAVCLAYQDLYDKDFVSQKELEELSDPDAKKMDLLYGGVVEIFEMAASGKESKELMPDAIAKYITIIRKD